MQVPHDPKSLARNLRQALAGLRIDITHSDSLECVARQFGWRDWNTLAAQLNRSFLRMPEGWYVGGSRSDDYMMGLDPAETCAVIRYRDDLGEQIPRNSDSGFGTLMQHFRADTYLSKRVQLRAQLKTEAVTGSATMWLRVDGDKARILAFDIMERRKKDGPLVGTVGWQERSIVLDVPSDALSIHFGFYLRGGGSVWARKFRFSEVDVTVAVTDDIRPRRTAPTNLDFALVA